MSSFEKYEIKRTAEHGFYIGSMAFVYKTMGATDEQVKNYVHRATPNGIGHDTKMVNLYMSEARKGYSQDKGEMFNHPRYNLLKQRMQKNVKGWNK